MPYDSTITFTLDTICPWTYLAFLRLSRALTQYRSSRPSSPVTFTLRIAPYQLYPDFSIDGVNKHEWYRDKRYNGSDDLMNKYVEYMTALGRDEGVEMKLGEGEIANTFQAHRVLNVIQEEYSAEQALKALESLYDAYFCHAAHPSSPGTLHNACIAAGLDEEQAGALVGGANIGGDGARGEREVKMKIQEQAGNGVDSVPYVVFEGRRRDFTEVGAKTVEQYVKVLEQVAKEAV